MENRAKLLGVLALILPVSMPLQMVDAAGAEGDLAPEADAAVSPTALRPAPMMGDLVFDHDAHADEMELECDECHHETNAAPLNVPHEEYFRDLWIDCAACHHKAGSPELEPRSCYDCHDTRPRDIADERLSRKVILHQNCWKCHEVETGVEASASCSTCHTGPDEGG